MAPARRGLRKTTMALKKFGMGKTDPPFSIKKPSIRITPQTTSSTTKQYKESDKCKRHRLPDDSAKTTKVKGYSRRS